MEFFERIEQIKGISGRGKKSPTDRAADALSTLATAIADAPDATDLEVNTYIKLYTMRVEKAKRAYAKAVKAMAEDDDRACYEIAQRGLLHLEIAQVHGHSLVVQHSAAEASVQTATGGCEESIQQLAEGICRIKLLAEYRSLELSRELRTRLVNVVQALQDAIESYGHGDFRTAADTATGGIVWCQYIYARLGGDALFPPKQQTKSLRTLYKLACDLGLAALDPVSRQTKDGRKKLQALEGFLQSAVNRFYEGDISGMEKFVRLGGIEATSLTRHVARVKTRDLVSAMQSDSAPESRQSVKQIIADIRDLIDRHHPNPDRALLALEALQTNYGSLRRAVRDERWDDAKKAIQLCRYENDAMAREAENLAD